MVSPSLFGVSLVDQICNLKQNRVSAAKIENPVLHSPLRSHEHPEILSTVAVQHPYLLNREGTG